MPYPRRECEFQLMQYVPDPVRNEFVHVGVIVREPGGRVMAVKFTSDWRRVRCLDPEADTGMLEGLESELRRRFEEDPDGNLMRLLEDSFSNSVQLTRARGYLAESVEAGVEELMRLYVEPPRRGKVSRLSGRAAIQLRLRTEFERAGVWDLVRKRIAAAQYTRAGDPLRIDVGYRSAVGGVGAEAQGRIQGMVRMFHAVSLEPGSGAGVEAAKGLALSAASLAAGVERVEGARLELTAVVEPVRGKTGNRDEGTGKREEGTGNSGRGAGEPEPDLEWVESYRFAVETMEERGIRVLTTADLVRVAETARRELGV